MTETEAKARLEGTDGVSYDDLDEIFGAFGFTSRSPTFETEVYYHPAFPSCGLFTARDDGVHLLTPRQVQVVRGMIACVQFHRWSSRRTST